MPFCSNCGQQLADGVKFCAGCGSPVGTANNTTQRKQEWAGSIIKCPNCSEDIPSFTAVCPSCGYELRETKVSGSLKEFEVKLEQANTNEDRVTVIRNFPVPNTKGDILEFMILASSNIKGEVDKSIFEAWSAKLEQTYRKAQMTLSNDPIFSEIEIIYKKTEKTLAKEKISHTTTSVGKIVLGFFKAMPNLVFAIVLVGLVIFNLIRLFKGEFAGIDIIFDAIILGATYGITEKKKKKKIKNKNPMTQNDEDNYVCQVKIPSAVVGGTSKNYAVVESLFIQAGFTNVKTVPLNDLTFGLTKKVGAVNEITINGKEISSYFKRKFNADVPVLITYHCLKK